MEQLEENLGALDLRLSPEYEAALEEASRPKFNGFRPLSRCCVISSLRRDYHQRADFPSLPVRAKERR